MFEYGVDDPDRLACSIFLFYPDTAEQIVVDYLNRALFVQDHHQAALWSTVLTLIENMQSGGENELDAGSEPRLAA